MLRALLHRLFHRHRWSEWTLWLWKKRWGQHPDAFTYRRFCSCGALQYRRGRLGEIKDVLFR